MAGTITFDRIKNDNQDVNKTTYMLYDSIVVVNGKTTKNALTTTPKAPSLTVNYRKITKRDSNESFEFWSLTDTEIVNKISEYVISNYCKTILKRKYSPDDWRDVTIKVKFTDQAQEVVDEELDKVLKAITDNPNINIQIDNSEGDLELILHCLYVDLSSKIKSKASITVVLDNVFNVKCEANQGGVNIAKKYVDIGI